MPQDEELRRSQVLNGAASNLIEMSYRNERVANGSRYAIAATERLATPNIRAEESLTPVLQVTDTYSPIVTGFIKTENSTHPQENSAAFIKKST